jgi:hypothetical protein
VGMKIWWEKSVKKWSQGSPRRKTEYNIKMYLQEMTCEVVD